jgi:hypothetical protein
VDVNTASKEALLRVPGFGVRAVGRILKIRRYHRLDEGGLVKVCVPMKRAQYFLIAGEARGDGGDGFEALMRAVVRFHRLESAVSRGVFSVVRAGHPPGRTHERLSRAILFIAGVLGSGPGVPRPRAPLEVLKSVESAESTGRRAAARSACAGRG